MNIITRKRLSNSVKKYNQANLLFAIYEKLDKNFYKCGEDVTEAFPGSSKVKKKDNEIVFRKGSGFRMVIKFDYSKQRGMILFVGTHDDYEQKYLKGK